jgi:hypothetical protein
MSQAQLSKKSATAPYRHVFSANFLITAGHESYTAKKSKSMYWGMPTVIDSHFQQHIVLQDVV